MVGRGRSVRFRPLVGRGWASFLDVHRWHGMAGMHPGHVRARAGRAAPGRTTGPEDGEEKRGRRETQMVARHQCTALGYRVVHLVR